MRWVLPSWPFLVMHCVGGPARLWPLSSVIDAQHKITYVNILFRRDLHVRLEVKKSVWVLYCIFALDSFDFLESWRSVDFVISKTFVSCRDFSVYCQGIFVKKIFKLEYLTKSLKNLKPPASHNSQKCTKIKKKKIHCVFIGGHRMHLQFICQLSNFFFYYIFTMGSSSSIFFAHLYFKIPLKLADNIRICAIITKKKKSRRSFYYVQGWRTESWSSQTSRSYERRDAWQKKRFDQASAICQPKKTNQFSFNSFALGCFSPYNLSILIFITFCYWVVRSYY